MELSQVAKILGGEKVLGRRLQSKMDLVEIGSHGVTKDAVTHLAQYLSLSSRQMAALLPVTERTLQRYGSKRHLSSIVSEHVLHIAEAVVRGTEVLGSRERFIAWINHPNTSLSDKKPLELLSSRFGTELVLDELGRIEHGVYS